MEQGLIDFIKDNKDLISDNNFKELYSRLSDVIWDTAKSNPLKISELSLSSLSDVLFNSGINPLLYLNEIPSFCFFNSKLKRIPIPEGIIRIGYHALKKCENLTEIKIPDSVIEIDGVGAFEGCKNLSRVEIGKGLKEIPSFAFNGCDKIKEIHIPGNVLKIGTFAFYSCENLTEVIIDNGTKYLGNRCFSNCYNLSDITLPESIESSEPGTLGYDPELLDRSSSLTVHLKNGSYAESAIQKYYKVALNQNKLIIDYI